MPKIDNDFLWCCAVAHLRGNIVHRCLFHKFHCDCFCSDTERVQNKVICLWIETTYSMNVASTWRVRSDFPVVYVGLSLGPQDPRGLQQTVARIESRAGIKSVRLNFVKIWCLNYYSRNLVLFNFRVITPESSIEFPGISIWRLVKPYVKYCVDILKACWLRPVFAESYRLLCVTPSKEPVAVHAWNAPDQWHNWRTSPLCQAKCKNRPPT